SPDALDGASLVVNTTSLGMVGQPPLEIDLAGLPQTALVTDIVYAPLMTDLLAQARERGNPIV
ncbi:MAG TPA: shikimate dehydrogenase, partial [Thalassospira sp.]|nr:shikimate dehydrogenase [Thalassospira sp.]